MSELNDKDKMIAYLITQLQEQNKTIMDMQKQMIELSKTQTNAPAATVDRPVSLSQVQAMIHNANTKPMTTELEKHIKKAIDLIVDNKEVFGF